jgi:hypothetical protein
MAAARRGVRSAGFAARPARQAGARTVWLASRNAVPAEVLPGSRDIRRLGVPVERIRMFDADMLIDTGHGHAALGEGFHGDEETHRWTDGLGRIPDKWVSNFAGAFSLELLLSPSGLRYLLAPTAAPRSPRRRWRTRPRRAHRRRSAPAPSASGPDGARTG